VGVDSSNNIDLVVSERGVSEAVTKVIALADASERTEGTLNRLKAALSGIRAGGLSSLVSELQSTSVGTQALKSSTDGLASAQRASSAASTASAAATKADGAAAAQAATQKAALARIEAEASKNRTRYAQEMLGQWKAAAVAEAQATAATLAQAAAQEKLAEASEVNTVKTDNNAAKIAEVQAQVAAQEELQASNAALIAQYAEMSESEAGETASQLGQVDAADSLTAAYNQLAAAQLELTESKAGYKEIQSTINDGWFTEAEAIQYTSTSMQRNAEATSALAAAQSNLAEVQSALNAQTSANVVVEKEDEVAMRARNKSLAEAAMAELGATESSSRLEKGIRQEVSANIAGSASLGLLEGRTISMTRAASQFLTKILPFGEIIQAAFPVIGLVALIAVLGIGYTAAKKFFEETLNAGTSISEAYRSINDSGREANDTLQATVDKLTQANDKLEKKYDPKTGMRVVLDDLLKGADDLGKSLDSDLKKFDALAKEKANQVGTVGGAITNQTPTQEANNMVGGMLAEIARKQADLNTVIANYAAHNDLEGAQNAKKAGEADISAFRSASIDKLKAAYENARKAQTSFKDGLNDSGKAFTDSIGATDLLGHTVDRLSETLGNAATKLHLTKNTTAVQNIFEGGVTQLQDQARNADLQSQLVTQNTRHQKDEGSVIDASAEAKAVRKNWEDATQAFKDYQGEVAKSGTNATVAQDQAWWEQEMSKLMPANKPKGQDEISKYVEQGNTQQHWVDDQTSKLKDQLAVLQQHGVAKKANAEYDRILQEAASKDITLTQEQKTLIEGLTSDISEAAAQAKVYDSIIKQADQSKGAPAQHAEFQAEGQKALTDPKTDHDAINVVLRRENEEYLNILDPLRQYNKGIADQTALLGKFGQEATVAAAIQALTNSHIKTGNDLTQQQIAGKTEELKKLEDEQLLQSDIGKLYGDNADKLRQLNIQQEAYNQGKQTGNIGTAEYQNDSIQNQAQQNKIKDNSGQGAGSDLVFNALAKYTASFQNFGTSVQSILDNTISKSLDGIGNILAKWIVTGGKIGTMFKQLGQDIAQSILSALIKVGVELLIVTALSKLFSLPGTDDNTAKKTATAVAGIAAITVAQLAAFALLDAPAWSIAEAVSIASFGGADAAATAGIAAVQAAGRHADGGFISGAGTGTSDSILSWLSNGEYVMDAKTTAAIGRQNLDAIRAGARNVGSNSPGVGGNGLTVGGKSTKFTIEDHTAGVKWQTIPIGEDEMRVIARDEGKSAVYKHADDVIGQSMSNGNSKTRRGLVQYTNARPTR
jgi:hypothetical protein